MNVPMIGICRHRLVTDGQGVTTLVAFHGCPLRCKYCLNAQCLRSDGVWRLMTVQEILDEVMVDDLYFKASKDGQTVSFCVEFYLRGQDTDVYKAVEGLQVGDVIDVTGYLYWYNGANPHVIGVTKAQ